MSHSVPRRAPAALLTVLMSAAAPAGADMLGVWVGAEQWNYDIAGSLRYQSTSSSDDIDVNDDLGYDDSDLTRLYLTLEHPLPMLPNVRLSSTRIDESANGNLTSSVTFGGTTYNLNEAVSSEVKIDQTDITLYYRILDNVVSLDLGLNAKYMDIEATLSGAISGTETAEATGWVPMLYGAVGADLPFTGLSAVAEGALIAYQDSRFHDINLRVSYQTPLRIGVSAGYRSIRLEVDDIDDTYGDIEFDGLYLGAFVHF